MVAGGPPPGPVIGSSPRRKEDPRLLLGAGRYLADRSLPGQLHAAVLRSPHGHARIRAIRVPEGVMAFTARDLAADLARAPAGVPGSRDPGSDLAGDLGGGLAGDPGGHAPGGPARRPGSRDAAADLPGDAAAALPRDAAAALPRIPARICTAPSLEPYLQPPLAEGEVRYAGEPVAVVVAPSRYEAEDALERIEVDYEPLPACTDATQGTVAGSLRQRRGDVEAAFRSAAHVVGARFSTGRQTAVPLETRGLLAAWDAAGGCLLVQGLTKVAYANRAILARLLGLPESAVEFVEGDVGGGFGVRGEFYPEDLLVPWLARRLRRPVKWVEDRREHLQATNHSRQLVCDAELAVAADGRFLALRCAFWYDQGAYVRTHGLLVPEATLALLPGPYRYDAFDLSARMALTHKTPVGTYRGPGRYESCFVRERLVDLAARRLGRDPVDLRLQNLVRPEEMPYECGTTRQGQPLVYEPSDYPAHLRQVVAALDAPAGASVGLGLFVEESADRNWEYARVEVDPGGEVTVFTGASGVGQGVETLLAQICAATLDVPYEAVRVVHGDSRRVPYGVGSFGSRTAVVGGNAARSACLDVRAQALRLAAERLEVRPEDLEIAGGVISVRGAPARRTTLGELAAEYRPPLALGLTSTAVHRSAVRPSSLGVHAAAVRVDRRTGAVETLRYVVGYDVGRAVHPGAIAGQIAGGVAQGVGGTLLEDLRYDAAGQLRAGSLADYLLPTAVEAPRVEALIWEDPSPGNPLGVKGAGEAGTPGPGAALANAVAAALGEAGEPLITGLPLVAEDVWRCASP